jgi:hypothetical protein
MSSGECLKAQNKELGQLMLAFFKLKKRIITLPLNMQPLQQEVKERKIRNGCEFSS